MLVRALALTVAVLAPATVLAQQPPSATSAADIIANISCRLLTRPYFEGKITEDWIPFSAKGRVARGPGNGPFNRDADTRGGMAPYGVPYRVWGNAEFSALKDRARQCNPGPESAYTLSLLLDAITRQQSDTVGYNQRQGAVSAQADARRNEVLAELAAIEGLSDAAEQVQRLRRLQSLARTMPELADQVGAAIDAVLMRQDRQQEAAARQGRMQQEEQRLAAERDAVQRQELEAQQRREALERARATRLAMERQAEKAERAGEQQDAESRRRVEAERGALSERGAQVRQALAAQQQAEASEAAAAQAARDRAAQIVLQRDAARRAQADEAARQRAADQQADTPRRQAAVAAAVAMQQGAIGRLGIPERYLGARVMMLDQTLRYVPGVTLRDYLAVMLQFGTTVSGAEARSGR